MFTIPQQRKNRSSLNQRSDRKNDQINVARRKFSVQRHSHKKAGKFSCKEKNQQFDNWNSRKAEQSVTYQKSWIALWKIDK